MPKVVTLRMPERYDLRHILFTLVHSVPFKTYFKEWGSDLDRKTLIQFDARTMDDFHNVMEQLFSVVQSIREKERALGIITSVVDAIPGIDQDQFDTLNNTVTDPMAETLSDTGADTGADTGGDTGGLRGGSTCR